MSSVFEAQESGIDARTGGGIIGCTTAYFLTRHPSFNPSIHKITILEAQSIASGASGKAGGLLALWAYPSCIVPLSYKLHAELAKEHDGPKRWGYRTLHAGSLKARGKIHTPTNGAEAAVEGGGEQWQKLPKLEKRRKSTTVPIPQDLNWFDQECIKGYSEMGTPNTTAQVHPYLFTTSMAELATAAGVQIILGSVTAIDYFGPNGVKGVTYEDKDTKHIHTLPASDVVLAAGPWTSHVFPEAPIDAIRAHSVVIKADVSPWAVFTEIDLPKDFGRKEGGDVKKRRHGLNVNPEMYARPDGTVYACGRIFPLFPLSSTHLLTANNRGRRFPRPPPQNQRPGSLRPRPLPRHNRLHRLDLHAHANRRSFNKTSMLPSSRVRWCGTTDWTDGS